MDRNEDRTFVPAIADPGLPATLQQIHLVDLQEHSVGGDRCQGIDGLPG